ncbi:MiaB/RimO family radical SAM methylthiotransferase [Caldilinea sp.]|uniref:MiaB/RimO family radical SAM methylthiotransferase n=1 Tax=Caldilinea sp. TaxID=2293560 RepID=UPI002C798F80|nr:MiaB/RimO family radical SAM methylthiotransferase [Anaerolineales bacterium]HQY94520.1 MiaB/RimO family radical SAM methylthiotransferase [Caldilinea sp.]
MNEPTDRGVRLQDDAHESVTYELTTDQTSTAARKYHIWTIGCQMNVADSNHVAAELEKIGYGPTDQLDEADVVVLNTCVVRQSAEDKAVGKLGSLKPWKKGKADRAVALMGCMVGVKPSPQLLASYPYVDVFMPPSEATPLVNFLRQAEIDAEMAEIERQQLAQRYHLQDAAQPIGTVQSIKHLALSGEAPVAAHVPIVYGCSHACTFCIIPFRRGVERSRPVEEIVNEVRGLVAQGVREVTLLGQIVDRYGYDWRGELGNSATVKAFLGESQAGLDEPFTIHHSQLTSHNSFDLADLLRAVHEIDGLWRIRFLTSHPNYMTDRILETVRDLPKVCPHIEVPIQAGDDEMLERMKRGYTVAEYRGLIERIRAIVPAVAINTDIIVGFCGETDAQFEHTVEIVRDLKFDKVHLARYSPRPGTVSERRLPDDVPDAEKVRRHKRLEDLQEQVGSAINQRFLGEIVEVLVEDRHKGKWRGRNRQNKLVFIESDLPLRGRLVDAQITWAGPWSMQGRFVRDASPLPDKVEPPKQTFTVTLNTA